jgi:hypothetical protein
MAITRIGELSDVLIVMVSDSPNNPCRVAGANEIFETAGLNE